MSAQNRLTSEPSAASRKPPGKQAHDEDNTALDSQVDPAVVLSVLGQSPTRPQTKALRGPEAVQLAHSLGNRAFIKHVVNAADGTIQRQSPEGAGGTPEGGAESEADEPVITEEHTSAATSLTDSVSGLQGEANEMKRNAMQVQWVVAQWLGRPVSTLPQVAHSTWDWIKTQVGLVQKFHIPNIRSRFLE